MAIRVFVTIKMTPKSMAASPFRPRDWLAGIASYDKDLARHGPRPFVPMPESSKIQNDCAGAKIEKPINLGGDASMRRLESTERTQNNAGRIEMDSGSTRRAGRARLARKGVKQVYSALRRLVMQDEQLTLLQGNRCVRSTVIIDKLDFKDVRTK
jgi:hypothetical protein